jgi:hypothetical protein
MNAMKLFSWFNKPQRDLEASINGVNTSLKEVLAQNEKLKAENAQLGQYKAWYDQQQEIAAQPQSYAIAFAAINAFSIERGLNSTGVPITTIGWLDKEGGTNEWYFHCNQDTHEGLVRQFKAYKGIH